MLVFRFEVKGFDGSKADTLGAMRWREPGCEFGEAIVALSFVLSLADIAIKVKTK